jgi:transglutaminase-like putative cysteine protease
MKFVRGNATTEPLLPRRSFDFVCLTMGVVLALHATHLPIWLVGALAMVLAVRFSQRRRNGGRPPLWLKLPLIAILLLAVIGYYGTLFGREPGSAFAVGLLVLKTLECDTVRDARVGIAFACFALMATLLFDQSMLLTLIVAVGLIPALATLRSLETARRPAGFLRELASSGALLAAGLPLAAIAFLFVPRLGSPLWGAPAADQTHTGLSSSMAPGDLTQLLIDDSPAMRVTFDGATPAPMERYFRTFVMWHFDGRRWDRGYGRPAPPAALDANGPTLSYQITLQPTQRRALPALDVPVAPSADARLSADREMLADNRIDDTRSYRVVSSLHYRLQNELDDATRQLGLQLPPGFNPRSRALAAQWRARYGSDDEAIARAAMAMFHEENFRYTLVPAPLGRDSVDDFLFNTREGFCEHYSSSFTFLMRAAGIPARVVTGYQGGFWNNIGNYLLVRQSNAHAWTELWLAGRGWVRFDPTGAVRPDRVNAEGNAAVGDQGSWYQSAWLEGLRNRWDVVNQWWAQGVTGFDALRQQGLLTPFGVQKAEVGTLASVLAGCIAALVAIGLGWAMYRRGEGDVALRALHKLEARLARRGLRRRTGEAPGSFLLRAARYLPAQRKQLEALQVLYVDLRYAHSEPPPELLAQFVGKARNFRPARVVK